jgi:hypothetical protein
LPWLQLSALVSLRAHDAAGMWGRGESSTEAVRRMG